MAEKQKQQSPASPQVTVKDTSIDDLVKGLEELNEEASLDGLRQHIFLDRYSLKDEKGNPTEQNPSQMWRRVAAGLAKMEKTPAKQKEWALKFYNTMKDFKFVPGGRILAGAGTGYEVTYYNCYVIPAPQDSRTGIMNSVTQTVEIQSRGGGVGFNLSTLRPHGARVRKVNGTSSGPVSWAQLYSTANHDVIQQGGSRRGALMIMLHDWHPDIEEFIHIKEDLSKIPGANLSICVSDSFMDAVKNDQDWDLIFPDLLDSEYDEVWDGDIEKWKSLGKKVIVYKTVKAKDIWDQICTAAWRSAEPGLHFLERSNKWSNTYYYERLEATNPSLRAGTKVLTQEGIFPIENLEGKRFYVKNLQGKWSPAECFLSGKNKELYKITLNNGIEIYATAEHKWPVQLVGGGFGKVTTNDLHIGNILPFPKAEDIQFSSSRQLSQDEGFMLGWLYGDGWISERKNVVHVTSNNSIPSSIATGLSPYRLNENSTHVYTRMAYGFVFSEEDKVLADRVLQQVNMLKTDVSNVKKQNNMYYIQTTSKTFAQAVMEKYGADQKEKGIPSTVWNSGSEFIKGFVDGLISSDGFVARNANRIVFTTKHKQIANDLSTLLSFYGIKSNVRRSESTEVQFPNQTKYYRTYERFDVTIDGHNVINFGKIFTLSHQRKQENIQRIIREYKISRAIPDNELVRIKAVEKTALREDVWDISVYDDTHCFYINHCVTGNCGEQPLPAWGVCNLGAMNLSAFVKDGTMDYDSLAQNVRVAVRILDNTIDSNYYFNKDNEKQQRFGTRRTGLGTMGLGDALIKMGIKYGSDESLEVIEKIYRIIRDNAYDESANIAKEKGAFPEFDEKKYLQGEFIKRLPRAIQKKIAENGIRNAVVLTQAPTGTTSLLAGVSSGIEPVYDFITRRTDRTGTHIIYHPLLEEWKQANPDKDVAEKPSYFVGANDLTPEDHVKVQAAVQYYTDSSISKTVNAPNDHTVEDVKRLYMMAYDLGCKGVTYFRDGSRMGVLEHVSDKEEKKVEKQEEEKKPVSLRKRPHVLNGKTYRVETPVGSAWICINEDEQGNIFEVFINIGKAGTDVKADAEALGRLISLMFRIPSDYSQMEVAVKLADQLRGIGGSSSMGLGNNRVRSLADAVGKVISEHIKSNTASLQEEIAPEITEEPKVMATNKLHKDICPSCGQASFVYEEGCSKCYSCGYSKC